MTKYRKHGVQSAGNADRYSKVTAAQYLHWTIQNRPPDHDYCRCEHGRYNLTSAFLGKPEKYAVGLCLHCTCTSMKTRSTTNIKTCIYSDIHIH